MAEAIVIETFVTASPVEAWEAYTSPSAIMQ